LLEQRKNKIGYLFYLPQRRQGAEFLKAIYSGLKQISFSRFSANRFSLRLRAFAGELMF
jgi:hypothetical protein